MIEAITIIALGLVAGFTGLFTASSALLIIPVLIFLGFPAHEALALNIFASFISWIIISLKLNTEKNIKWEFIPPLAVAAALGALTGSLIVMNTSSDTMETIVGALMIIIVIFLLFKKDIGAKEFVPSKTRKRIGMALYLLGSTYAGFFAGGSGIILRTINLTFFGFTITQSAATGGLLWVISSGVTSTVYAFNGYLNGENLLYVAALTASMSFGSYLAAKYMLKASGDLLKKAFMVTILFFGVMLFFKAMT